MKCARWCMGVHGGAWRRFTKIHEASMHCTQCGIDSPTCPLQQSCLAMHEKHMEAQATMWLKGDSGDGRVRSYQVPSKVQGEAGYSMRREDEVPKRLAGMHGGAWDSASSNTWSMHVLHSVRQSRLSIPI